jgi:hypothetical protein
LEIPDLLQWIFRHDVVELCTAVKGAMLRKILAAGAKRVVYLDPDVAVFDSLTPVVAMLDRHDILLTPHLLAPERTVQGIEANEIGALKHGIYNLGFVAVRNSAEGRGFAEWWEKRLYGYCYDEIPSGLFTDQRWADLIPALFPGTGIVRDPGCNVACWNISNRPLAITRDGDIESGDATLRFFHFTKVNTVGEGELRRFAGGRGEVLELLRWYRERLAAKTAVGLPDNYWAFARYEDSAPIEKWQRRAYRASLNLADRFPNPFASGAGSFQEWCATRPPAAPQ